MKNVVLLVIDEAHCISQWKDNFRRAYGEIVRLRSGAAFQTPLLVTSATLPPHMLHDLYGRLEMDPATTFVVNRGNDRPNLVPLVCRMKGTTSSLPILSFLLHEGNGEAFELQRSMVFFNSRDLAFQAAMSLRHEVPEESQQQINFLHAGRSRHARERVLKDFREGKIQILCATEAAGMVSSCRSICAMF